LFVSSRHIWTKDWHRRPPTPLLCAHSDAVILVIPQELPHNETKKTYINNNIYIYKIKHVTNGSLQQQQVFSKSSNWDMLGMKLIGTKKERQRQM
jgi:hypothetical protein